MFKPLLLALLAAASAAGAAQDEIQRAGAAPSAIAAAMKGRTAGTPVSCISQFGLRSTRPIAGALLFRGRGTTVYVNEGPAGCRAMAFGRAFRTHNPTGRLCRGDIVTAFDPVSGAEFGGCALGDFIPYHRTEQGAEGE